jgi:hypothetical protein
MTTVSNIDQTIVSNSFGIAPFGAVQPTISSGTEFSFGIKPYTPFGQTSNPTIQSPSQNYGAIRKKRVINRYNPFAYEYAKVKPCNRMYVDEIKRVENFYDEINAERTRLLQAVEELDKVLNDAQEQMNRIEKYMLRSNKKFDDAKEIIDNVNKKPVCN